jgi:aminopeptidase N
MGDSVSPRQWNVIWHSEGWATYFEVLFDHRVEGSELTPRRFFREVYRSERQSWRLAPAKLDGDPANLFSGFAVYNRPGAMLEGLRQIIGGPRFADFTRGIAASRRFGDIRRGQFVAEAEQASGFHGAKLRRLGRYLRQWLLWEKRPHLAPSDF